MAGRDTNKDQSYFLCQLNQEQLSRALFPIGELTKPEVRRIARDQNLITADKKDSQGLCFVGKVRLPEFLQQKLAPKAGKVIEVHADAARFAVLAGHETEMDMDALCAPYVFEETDGKVVGEHRGAHYYTIGQRKGLNIGGTPLPLFIIGTDTATNTIYAAQGEDHPGLYRPGLFIDQEEVHWVRDDLRMDLGESRRYQVRIRYRQDLEGAALHMRENGLYILFDQPQKAIAAGQFAVWYEGEELVGSGVIA